MEKPVSGISDYLPPSLDYRSMKKSLIKNGKRRTVKLLPSTNVNQFAFNGNRIIEFNLPSVGFLDTHNTTLIFDAYQSGGNGNSCFDNNIESIFNRVQVMTGDGSQTVENLQDYGVGACSKYKFIPTINYSTILTQQAGFSNDLNLRVLWANEGQTYSVNMINCGIMQSAMQYLPLGILAKVGGFSRALTIQITLENPSNCMIATDGTSSLNYVLQNVYLQMELLEFPEYEMELYNKIMSGSMVMGIPYTTSDTWKNTIQQGRSGDITFQINMYKQYVTGMRNIFIGPNSLTTDYTNTFTDPSLQNYQMILANQYYPTQPAEFTPNIINTAAQFNELLKYFNKTKDYVNGILATQVSALTTPEILTAQLTTPDTFTVSSTVASPQQQVIPITQTLNPSGGWTVGASSFTPSISGYYLVNAMIDFVDYSTVASTSTASDFQFLLGDAGGGQIGDAFSEFKRATYVLSTGITDTNNGQSCTISDIVFLNAGTAYSMYTQINAVTISGGANFNITVTNMTVNASLVVPAVVPASDTSFMIAQTFKIFHDCLEYMYDKETFLDGVDTTQNNQIVFRFTMPSAFASTLDVFSYIDYIGCIAIDKNGVSVIK